MKELQSAQTNKRYYVQGNVIIASIRNINKLLTCFIIQSFPCAFTATSDASLTKKNKLILLAEFNLKYDAHKAIQLLAPITVAAISRGLDT